MISSLIGVAGGGPPCMLGPVSAGSMESVASQLRAADPTKNPQPLSLYVFLFMSAALALLLLSMAAHMKRARRNLSQPEAGGQPGPAAPPAAPPVDPPGAG